MNSDHPSTELLLRRLDAELPAGAQPALDAHLVDCAECSARLAKLRTLSGAIEDCSAGLLDTHPANARRRALLESMGSRSAAFQKTALTALAIAAAVILAVGIPFFIEQPPGRPGAAPQIAGDDFIALPYSDENLSAEGAVVLQVELPRSAVALAGIPVGDGPSDGRVKAEVMVGADGLARAIRFLN